MGSNLKVGVGSVCGSVRPVGKDSVFRVWCRAANPDPGGLWLLRRAKGYSVSDTGRPASDNPIYISGTWGCC
jgi:hypothetical protein